MGSLVWKITHGRWGGRHVPAKPGYTLLLPVPGDLSLFLKLALEVCARQDLMYLAEIVVVPDMTSAAFRAHFDRCSEQWPHLPMRLVEPSSADRLLAAVAKNPHHNHWMQLVTGVESAKTEHVLLHDADCFILDPIFFRAHYEEAVSTGADCLGVTEVWDDWYRTTGMSHVTATWELLFRRDWVRGFPPYMHRGQRASISCGEHDFDTLLLAQCMTPPEKILRHDHSWDFVHFNYVICTYRWFCKSRFCYEDEHFRLLLIRLLCNAMDWPAEPTLPDLDEFRAALQGMSKRISYSGAKTRENYQEFREKLQALLRFDLFDREQVEFIMAQTRQFDEAFM